MLKRQAKKKKKKVHGPEARKREREKKREREVGVQWGGWDANRQQTNDRGGSAVHTARALERS